MPFMISIITAIVLLGLIFTNIDLTLFIETISATNIWVLAVVFLFFTLQTALLCLRWHMLIRLDRPQTTAISSFYTVILAQLVNATLLSGVSGMVVRVGLAVRQGMTINRAICASLIDRLYTLGTIVLCGAIALPFAIHALPMLFSQDLRSLHLALIIVVLVCMAFSLRLFTIILQKFVRRNLLLLSSFNYVRRFIRRGDFWWGLGLSVLAQLLYFIAVFVMFQNFNPNLSLLYFSLVIPWITILSSLPVSFGAWGIREYAFVMGFSLLGVSKEVSLTISIQIGLLSLLNIIILSIPVLLHRKTPVLLHELAAQAKEGLAARIRKKNHGPAYHN